MFQEFCPPTSPTRAGKIKYCKRSKDGEHCWDWRVKEIHRSYWIIEWYCSGCGKIEDKIRWFSFNWKDDTWWHTKRMNGVDIVLYCLLSKINEKIS